MSKSKKKEEETGAEIVLMEFQCKACCETTVEVEQPKECPHCFQDDMDLIGEVAPEPLVYRPCCASCGLTIGLGLTSEDCSYDLSEFKTDKWGLVHCPHCDEYSYTNKKAEEILDKHRLLLDTAKAEKLNEEIENDELTPEQCETMKKVMVATGQCNGFVHSCNECQYCYECEETLENLQRAEAMVLK